VCPRKATTAEACGSHSRSVDRSSAGHFRASELNHESLTKLNPYIALYKQAHSVMQPMLKWHRVHYTVAVLWVSACGLSRTEP